MPDESTNKGSSRKKNLHGTTKTAQDSELRPNRGATSPSVEAAQQAIDNERLALDSGEESAA